jgi:hypothetical protein
MLLNRFSCFSFPAAATADPDPATGPRHKYQLASAFAVPEN